MVKNDSTKKQGFRGRKKGELLDGLKEPYLLYYNLKKIVFSFLSFSFASFLFLSFSFSTGGF